MAVSPESAIIPSAVILVGLPGSGKTTVGGAVAQQLNWPFIDFDKEIERRERSTIAEIFRTRGEGGFRGIEADLSRELAGLSEAILAPGGGWVTQPAAMALLRPPGRMIYLRVSPEVALARMGGGASLRPLLEGEDALGSLRRLYDERRGAYSAADLEVDTEALDLQEVINRVRQFAAA
jgi:shikimate kinase